MKNILGTEEELDFYNKEGKLVYKYFKDSHGYSYEYTYNSKGNELTYKNSYGYSYEYTRDSNGKILTYKNSGGHSYEKTYDSNGNLLTYKDSDGVTRGFHIPEYTMEELVEKLGNFKIKK